MQDKLRQWIFVILLGVVLPSVLLALLSHQNKQITAPETVVKNAETIQKIRVLHPDASVSEMALEDYVVGVVLAEMPADFELEALKAQAVLARTYALKREDAMDKHTDCAVCTDPECCQGYCAVEDYSGGQIALNKVKSAVSATNGQVLTYCGQLIEATYFSCSGGRTEDALAVWGTDVPYLQAINSPGEEQSVHYITTVVIDLQELQNKLGLQQGALTVSQVKYTDGGGIAQMQIGGKIFTGVQLRQLLGLKSTAFRMNVVGNNMVITVKGYGHRVGMSQYGADAMAAGGSSFQQILTHYYQGTDLMKYPI